MLSVTIIIPAYDAAAVIGRCLASIEAEVRATTGVSIEAIVVDDASRDGTPEIVARDHPNVRLIRLERNVGADGARNAALALAGGEVLAFVDADCALLPGWATALAAAFRAGARAVMGRVVAPAEPRQRLCALLDLGEFLGAESRPIRNFATLNVALHRSVMAGRAFAAEERICGDRMLSWRLVREGVPIRFDAAMALLHVPELGAASDIVARRRRYAHAFVLARRRDPTLPGARLVALGLLGAPIACAARLWKDLGRLVSARRAIGIGLAGVPVYAALLAAFRALDTVFIARSFAAIRRAERAAAVTSRGP